MEDMPPWPRTPPSRRQEARDEADVTAGPPRNVRIDTERSRLDVALIHEFLTASYWAKGIPIDVVRKSIDNSLCFGAYEGERMVGFARVVTDRATFAYLADVFVIESRRGRGISARLMETIVSHPDLQGLRRWSLVTRDAHGLYEKFGFRPLAAPERFMERHDPTAYERRDR
jgi:GNAT superfamily N-acetyltransferase